MIRYATLDTPLGPLLVATSEFGIVRIAFPEEPVDDVLAELGNPDSDLGPGALDEERGQIQEYLVGTRRHFDLSVDLSALPGDFTRQVLRATATIPYAATSTYGDVAAMTGHPRAARAVGNALNVNPVPLVIPCHRVILASGSLGGYAGREDRKRQLLALEGSV